MSTRPRRGPVVAAVVVALLLVSLAIVIWTAGRQPEPADEPSPTRPPLTAEDAPGLAAANPDVPAREQGPTVPDAPVDAFGINRLYPTEPGGMIWEANWTQDRVFDGLDPADPWFDADHGSATYEVRENKLYISGPAPRMYILDPAQQRQWRDVEITMYFQRVRDEGTPFAGMVSIARTNHGQTGDEREDLCDTRGMGGRMRYDGRLDFEKETSHPRNDAAAGVDYWPEGMPFERWLGYKYVVYDLPDGSVKMELWLDESGGAGGGSWTKVNEAVDNGALYGDEPCARGIDPQMPLTASTDRPGSESGKPNLSVYFRSDNVGEDGLVYRWGSVREIQAPA